MSSKTFQIKTLTPLWTGGVNRDSKKIHETGIIGSLRWWYEGIIRGLGGYACDSIENPCPGSMNSGDRCNVCDLFGCTGWSRGFRCEIRKLNSLPLFFAVNPNVYISNGNWLFRIFGGREQGGSKRGRGLDTRFQFGTHSLWGDEPFDMKVTPLHHKGHEIIDIFSYIIWFAATYGGIGAKTQNGFGQVAIRDGLNNDSKESGYRLINKNIKKYAGGKNGSEERLKGYFSTKYFFSALYEIHSLPFLSSLKMVGNPPQNFDYRSHFVPCSFDIRYKSSTKNPVTGRGIDCGLRPFFIERFGKKTASALLGETKARMDKDRSASKIHVSHLVYDHATRRYRLKIWGYIPADLEIPVQDVQKTVDEFVLKHMFKGSRIIQTYDGGNITDD